MNAPNRFELHVLGDGEQKLTVEEDTKIPNAATLTINKEDHTLANMLRSQLLQMEHVLFAGYKVPHPLEPRFLLKIQTDSESTPIKAVQDACKGLILTLVKMREEFIKEFDTARAMGGVGTDTFAPAPGAADEGMAGDTIYGANATGAGPMEEGMGFGEFVE